jgi:hypothetical protein
MATVATGERAGEIGARYPRKVALRGDRSIELRLMDAGDPDKMLAFARALPADDLLFLRSNITEPAAVDGWIANIADGRTVTVLGVDGEAIGVTRRCT